MHVYVCVCGGVHVLWAGVSIPPPQLLQAEQGEFEMPNLKNRQLTLQSHGVHEVSRGWGVGSCIQVCVFVCRFKEHHLFIS